MLILGGSGFIGRNLVKFLVDNKLAGKIRVADKTIPAVAGMNAAHTAAFAGTHHIDCSIKLCERSLKKLCDRQGEGRVQAG